MEKLKLFAPARYWKMTPDDKKFFCNGCGPKFHGIGDYLVPDNILGVNITDSCDIHDFQYSEDVPFGNDTKNAADRSFRINMIRQIDNAMGDPPDLETSRFRLVQWFINADRRAWFKLKAERYKIAQLYYEAVSHFGGAAYWKGKNRPCDLGTPGVCNG
jgi:hypothetical protein